MIYIFFGFIFFILTALIHIILSRRYFLIGRKIKFFWGTFVFGLGGFIVFQYILIHSGIFFERRLLYIPIPFSACLSYIFLSFLYFIYFLSTFSGEESPSVKLYLLLKNGQKRTYKQIIGSFTDNEMVGVRIRSLITDKLINRSKSSYKILPKGKIVAQLFMWYRSLLGWKSSG
jgi:hypothetical protein